MKKFAFLSLALFSSLAMASNEDLSQRSTAQVFMDHLQQRYQGDLEQDLVRNYSPDVLMVTNYGTFHGFDGVRKSASILAKLVPTRKYHMDNLVFNHDNAFESWTVDANDIKVTDGIDAFIIRDGKIVVQTIYYTSQMGK